MYTDVGKKEKNLYKKKKEGLDLHLFPSFKQHKKLFEILMTDTTTNDNDEHTVDDDYYPMWTKVYGPKHQMYGYFNNFDGSFEWEKPDDYDDARDNNYMGEKLPYSAMPLHMGRLIAAKRIQIMVRARAGRKLVRSLKGDRKFGSMSEKERIFLNDHLYGWIELLDFTNSFRRIDLTDTHKRYPYWYHPGTAAEVWEKPGEMVNGENLHAKLTDLEARQAERKLKRKEAEARRKEHVASMELGLKEVHAKVNNEVAMQEFKAHLREKRAAEHREQLQKLEGELSIKHEDEIIQKKMREEKQAKISAERAVLHQEKMKEDEAKMHKEQSEHDKLVADLERRASVVLESGSGPWKLHVGIKSATGLRAADWALRGGGKSDPYAKIFLNGRQVGKTSALKKTLDPVWNEDIDVLIESIEELGKISWETSELAIRVYDYDLVGSDDLLGEIVFREHELLTLVNLVKDDDGMHDEHQIKRAISEMNNVLGYNEYNLTDPEGVVIKKKKEQAQGSITIAADLRVVLKKRHVLEAKQGSSAKKKKKQRAKEHQEKMMDVHDNEYKKAAYHAETGVLIAELMLPLDQESVSEWILETTFINARGLKKADRWGKSDPYVTVYVNGVSVGSSNVIKKTLNPDWNQTKDLLVHRKKCFTKKGKKTWKDSTVTFEVFDHDLVGMNDPLGQFKLKGQDLLGFVTAEARKAQEEEVADRQLFERSDKKGKGTLRVTAILKPAGSEAIAAVNAENERLAAIEARKVPAPWTVWLRMYDNVAHAEYWVHSQTGATMFDLPIPKESTKEQESKRIARVLPEELEQGPPLPYRQHMAALLIGKLARRRKARTRVLKKRGEIMSGRNGGGIDQIWIQTFHPYGCRRYFWNCITDEIVWDQPPKEMKELRSKWIRSYDATVGKFYYHQPPFDMGSWQWNIPKEFTPGGRATVVSAATSIQGMYRSFLSRMGHTRKGERKNMFSFTTMTTGKKKFKKKLRVVQRAKQTATEMSTADERAEIKLTKSVKRLEDVIENFELPFRHRSSRRSDRRKVLNATQTAIADAVTMSAAAGNRIAASRGLDTPALTKPTTEGKLSRTQQEIMSDEVEAFVQKVKLATEAVDGATAMIAWYEVETVYRLKRLLAGLTAMDIYHLSAPAQEDIGSAHEKLKTTIHDSEHVVSEMLGKLGKGFRKALRRWGKMMNEDCGSSLAAVSTSDLLPVDRTLEGVHDPLRYGRYYWMTVKKSRMMPFPVDLGGISYKRVRGYITQISKSIYMALSHANKYLMLVGDERDVRIGREEVCCCVLLFSPPLPPTHTHTHNTLTHTHSHTPILTPDVFIFCF